MIKTITTYNIHVLPLVSPRTGDAVKNQYALRCGNAIAFQSYDSLCAVYADGVLTLGRDWDYSRTTVKYLHQFLCTYCFDLYTSLRHKRSLSETLRAAIAAGVVVYDEDMV